MNRKHIIAIVLGALAGLAVLLLVAAPKEPVRIGYIGTLTGKYAALSTSGRDGAILAIEEVNASGGIGGRKVSLVLKNDGFDPALSLSAAEELVAEGVQAIIGPFSSSSAVVVMPYITEAKMVTVGPVVAGEQMAGRDDFFFKIYPSTSDFGTRLGQRALHSGAKTAVAVFDTNNRAYSEHLVKYFRKSFTAGGGAFLSEIPFAAAPNVSYTAVAQKALAASPAAIMLVASPIDAALICQQVRKTDTAVRFYSSSWVASREAIESGGAAVEGLVYFAPYDMKSTHPRYKGFVSRFRERFGVDPTFNSIFNYDAAIMIFKGLSQDPSARSERLKRLILGRQPHAGLQGDFSLTDSGDAIRTLMAHTIEGGAFVRAE